MGNLIDIKVKLGSSQICRNMAISKTEITPIRPRFLPVFVDLNWGLEHTSLGSLKICERKRFQIKHELSICGHTRVFPSSNA